jgi:hypothetical protein
VGHSTRKRTDFLGLLRAHGVRQLVDVRTIPRSRRNPQFNRAVLSRALRRTGIGYRHMAGLGGLRHAQRDSINTGWRNMSFRGYADYMQASDIQMALQKLIGCHSVTHFEMCSFLQGSAFQQCLSYRLGSPAIDPKLGEKEWQLQKPNLCTPRLFVRA